MTAMSDANSSGAESRPRSITVPPGVVPHFEAALRRADIAAAVRYHDDGSRTYRIDPRDWDEAAVIAAAERAVEDLRETLRASAVAA